MGDFVGVDPTNLRQLGDRLNDLANVLAKDGRLIKQTMTDLTSQLDYSIFARDCAQDGGDSHEFHKRADLADEMNRRTQVRNPAGQAYQIPGWGTVFPPGSFGPLGPNEARGVYTTMPYDTSPLTTVTSTEGVNDAHDLANAMKDPGSALSKQVFAQVAQSLSDYQGDDTYLRAFYEASGTDVFDIPAALRKSGHGVTDPSIPSDSGMGGGLDLAGQQLVNTFATSYAQAEKQGFAPEPTMPPGTFDDSINDNGPMPWSTQVFLKYGPPADQWSAQFLADLGSDTLAWQDGNSNWEDSLYAGDTAKSMNTPHPGTTQILALLSASPDASRLLLSGPDGAANAQVMIDACPWIQGVDGIPQIITNATADTAQFADPSRRAALNVIDALGTEQTTMSPAMAQGLAHMAAAFTSDLAAQASITNVTDSIDTKTKQLQLTPESLQALLADIGSDQGATEIFNAAVGGQATIAVKTSDPNDLNPLRMQIQDLSALQGAFIVAHQNSLIDFAAQKDAVNTDRQMWAGFVLGVTGATPVPWKGIDGAPGVGETSMQQLAGGFTSALAQIWPATKTANAQADAQIAFSGGYSYLDVPLAQGLIAKGVVTPADLAGQSWYVNDDIELSTLQQKSDFHDWVHGQLGAGPTTNGKKGAETWESLFQDATYKGLQPYLKADTH